MGSRKNLSVSDELGASSVLAWTSGVEQVVDDVVAALTTFLALTLCCMWLRRMTSPEHDQHHHQQQHLHPAVSHRVSQRRFSDAVCLL